MTKVYRETHSEHYSTIELPLTEGDKIKIKKDIARYYKVNLILVPLLILIFFWGVLYFTIFGALTLLWNVYAAQHENMAGKMLQHPKIVITGKITNKTKRPAGDGNDTIIFLGPEEFNITYANPVVEMETGDMIDLHYSQRENGTRDILLKMETYTSQSVGVMMGKPQDAD